MNGLWIVEGWEVAATAFALFAVAIVILGRLDRRRLDGENVWAKPFRFAVSLAIHFATFAAITLFCPSWILDSSALWVAGVASLAAGGIVFDYIAIQAARRQRSHYNTTTATLKLLYNAIGIGAVVVLVPAVVLGLNVATGPMPGWSLAARVGTATGLLVGALLTLVTGMRMGGAMSHAVGGSAVAPRTMWLTGWSLDRADVRPAHFLANHMMQVVPLAAAACSWLLTPPLALPAVVMIAAGWAVMTWSSFRAALAGKPLPKF